MCYCNWMGNQVICMTCILFQKWNQKISSPSSWSRGHTTQDNPDSSQGLLPWWHRWGKVTGSLFNWFSTWVLGYGLGTFYLKCFKVNKVCYGWHWMLSSHFNWAVEVLFTFSRSRWWNGRICNYQYMYNIKLRFELLFTLICIVCLKKFNTINLRNEF